MDLGTMKTELIISVIANKLLGGREKVGMGQLSTEVIG